MPMRKLKNYKPTRFMAETSHYSKQMADFAVMFIEQLTHTKGTWAGKPFELIDWQERIIRDLFGVLKPNGYRQFIRPTSKSQRRWESQSWPPLSPCSFAAVTVRNAPKSTVALQIDSRPPSFLMLLRIW